MKDLMSIKNKDIYPSLLEWNIFVIDSGTVSLDSG